MNSNVFLFILLTKILGWLLVNDLKLSMYTIVPTICPQVAGVIKCIFLYRLCPSPFRRNSGYSEEQNKTKQNAISFFPTPLLKAEKPDGRILWFY